MVRNPYNGKEINIEPLLRLLDESDETFQLEVCRAMKDVNLQLLGEFDSSWKDDLELINRWVNTLLDLK